MLDQGALLQAADEIEPLPTSLVRLAAVVADPESEIKTIVDVVAYDPALTGRLLQQANSAASAARSPIATVNDAVVRLGRGSVLSLTIGAALRGQLAEAVPQYGLAEGELWRAAVLATIAAELLPRYTSLTIPPETVTAALLADVGKLVMRKFLDPGIVASLDRAEEEGGLSRRQAEIELLGVHHGEVGGLVIQHWRLPEGIALGVNYHHDPDINPSRVGYATYLSCRLAEMLTGHVDTLSEPELFAHTLEALAITVEGFDSLCGATALKFAEVSGPYLDSEDAVNT